MKRFAMGLRAGLPALITLAAGCAHHGDRSTSAYVMGTIFVLIGLALGVALIMGLNKG